MGDESNLKENPMETTAAEPETEPSDEYPVDEYEAVEDTPPCETCGAGGLYVIANKVGERVDLDSMDVDTANELAAVLNEAWAAGREVGRQGG